MRAERDVQLISGPHHSKFILCHWRNLVINLKWSSHQPEREEREGWTDC